MWAYINGGLLPEKTASTELSRFRVPLELLPDAAAALPLSIWKLCNPMHFRPCGVWSVDREKLTCQTVADTRLASKIACLRTILHKSCANRTRTICLRSYNFCANVDHKLRCGTNKRIQPNNFTKNDQYIYKTLGLS